MAEFEDPTSSYQLCPPHQEYEDFVTPDIQNRIDAMKKLGRDPIPIGVVGFGSGGWFALKLASESVKQNVGGVLSPERQAGEQLV